MYYNLHTHTHYSNTRLLDCINKEDALIDHAHKMGLSGIAITDHECLSSHVRAQKHLKKRKKENPDDESWQNFKLILGNEIYLCRNDLSESNFVKGEDRFYHFILLALDDVGHKQLRELSTRAFKHSWYRNMRRVPTYYRDVEEVIGANPGHVWASSACIGGYLPQCLLQDDLMSLDKADNFMDWCMTTFDGNFSLELQPSNEKDQIFVNKELVKISNKRHIPYIITTDAHYLKEKDRKVHKAFLNSRNAEREVDGFYSTTYLMNEEEIHDFMDTTLNIIGPDGSDRVLLGLKNTCEIADKVKDYTLLKDTKLPYMPLEILEPTTGMIQSVIDNGMENLLKFATSDEQADRQLAYKIIKYCDENRSISNLQRIEEELKSITVSDTAMNQKWSRYLLQVSDYIKLYWAEGDSLVGPGRGSGVSFYINFILGISQIDPTREKAPMYPWRFLNPERASVLDVDIDIQGNRRNKCIRALKNQYGEFRAVEVVTFGTEKAKSAIKTACRGLDIDVDIATHISSFIESERGIQHTLDQTFYGDEENGIKPNSQFRDLMINKYPQVWEVARQIEGIISRLGKHAGGVVIVDEDFTERAAIMTTNKDEFVSQYELHDLEDLGLIKIDLLAVEALDRIRACIDLLVQYGYIKREKTLQETYENAIGVYKIERENQDMWKLVWENRIISLFQMEQGSGIQAIALTKPHSLEDLAAINSVMRLMAPERGAEQPLNKYARFKATHPHSWEREMLEHGLDVDERLMMHKYLDYEYGICATQEDLMSMVQNPLIGGFSLSWADKLRKAIAKKQPVEFNKLTDEFFANAKEKELSPALTDYIWNVLFVTQRGYSFNLSHTLSYSMIGLQEMNLAFNYPILFWNCANIIVDSMATDLITEDEDEIGYVEETDSAEEDEEEERSSSPVEYGKIAKAIGKMSSYGVTVHLPDINKSKLTFSPSVEDNSIYYGIKGISKINDKIAEEIILNRPYYSMSDFFSKVKLNKPQAISLIKSGALDNFDERSKIMREYILSISESKTDLNLRNMQMLMSYGLIPDTLDFERRVFNFNKYLKKSTFGEEYYIDNIAYAFFEKHFNVDLINFFSDENYIGSVNKKEWDKIYTRSMDKVRDHIKANKEPLLEELNWILAKEVWGKYADGSLSKWEMDSVSFYHHEHELASVPKDIYNISNFFDLSEEPEEEYSFTTKDGFTIRMNKLSRIAGTVLAKDKAKHTVTILTEDGVVNVKVWNSQFAKYDKQISEKQADGKKKVIEKSWFSRGNKLIFTGVRRNADFIPKVYKNSEWKYPIQLIANIDEQGFLELKNEREGE